MDNPAPTPGPQVTPTPVVIVRPQSLRGVHEGGAFSRFLTILFAPVLWLVRPLVFRVGHELGNPKVYLTSFSTLIYLWPIMVAGILGNWALRLGWVGEPRMGWIWLTVILMVIICIGADLNRTKGFILALIVGLLWVIGVLLNAKYQIPVLSNIHAYLIAQNVQYQPGLAKVMSLAIAIILVIVIFLAWLNGRYEITTMEITHRKIFETSDSLPRAAKRIKRDWRDITEAILGIGAGDVIVIDSNKNVVMRIPNVPFLWFFRHDVDHVLEVLATTGDAESVAAVEADGAHNAG